MTAAREKFWRAVVSAAQESNVNIVISGRTHPGKVTALDTIKALSQKTGERPITVETVGEIHCGHQTE